MSKRIICSSRRHALATSFLVILLSMLVGAVLWRKLPPQMAVHFNFAGEPDGYAPKAFAVFGLPLFFLGAQLLCAHVSLHLPENPRLLPAVILRVVPILSIFVSWMLYAHALGGRPDVRLWTQLAIGMILLLLGNAVPKGAAVLQLGNRNLPLAAKQKLARFSGYCLVTGGAAVCAGSFFGISQLFFAVVILVTVLPPAYSVFLRRSMPPQM